MFETGYFIKKKNLRDPILPLIVIVFLFCFGCANPNKALNKSPFFLSKEFMV